MEGERAQLELQAFAAANTIPVRLLRGNSDVRTKWRERCLLTNRKVHVDVGTRSVIGLCRGIDDEGALVVETVNETERCFAGVVTSF